MRRRSPCSSRTGQGDGDVYITASGQYAEIHTAERTHLIREQMQLLEDRLDPAQFFRGHRSAIVRFDLIEGLTRNSSGDYTVQLKGGVSFKVSRSRSDELERSRTRRSLAEPHQRAGMASS